MRPAIHGPDDARRTLISERIKVEIRESKHGLQEPGEFVWRKELYIVDTVLKEWTEVGFGSGEKTRTWYRRRHRNHYRVRLIDGTVYELYLDRGGTGKVRWWTLHSRLEYGTETVE